MNPAPRSLPSLLTAYAADTSLLELTSMTASGCAPCEAQSEAQSAESPSQFADEDASSPVRWEGTIGVEGEMTGDGRFIELNALRWDNLPIPLRFVQEDIGAHDNAQVVGLIQTIERGSNGAILATGIFDMGSEVSREAERHVREGLTTGVSMDLDDVSFEVRIAQELLQDDPMMAMLLGEGDAEDAMPEADEDGKITVASMKPDDEVRVTTDGRVRASTLVAIPAFATANIRLAGESENEDEISTLAEDEDPTEIQPICSEEGCTEPATVAVDEGGVDVLYCAEHAGQNANAALLASAFPVSPPASWFSDPKFSAVTPLTVTKDGQVYGHLAAWNTCHIGHTHRGCVKPPKSNTGYAHFHVGSVLSSDGAEIPVGHITIETRHALDRLTAASASAHYENTGKVAADVAAGEDKYGIWVAGAMRPTATDVQVRSLRASPLSGDWRRVGGNLELVHALAVNVPGFPIPRPAGLVASGAVQSLVASGMVPPKRVKAPGTEGALSADDLRYLKRLAQRERAEDQRQTLGDLPSAEALAIRVRSSELARKRSTFGTISHS